MIVRTILHVDMNAYFASVEQKANPSLKGKPLIVVGDFNRRAIVLAASYEARVYGIKTGTLYWQAKTLCPMVTAVVANHDLYYQQSLEILKLLEGFSDLVEMGSIDEAYLDITESLIFFKTGGEGLARIIQARISKKLNLPCSIGVAPNKLLAKLASDMKKPMGITVIRPENINDTLANLPVEVIPGIGNHIRDKLHNLGIKTCQELGEVSQEQLLSTFGFWGYWLKRWGQGEDDSKVVPYFQTEPAKSMGHNTTLPQDTSDPEIIKSFILLLAEKVAARLREGGYLGRTITLTLRYANFETISKSHTVTEPHNDGAVFYTVALKILGKFNLSRQIRLVGVSVSNLIHTPLLSFLPGTVNNNERLLKTIDSINKKYGSLTLKKARVLEAEKFGILEPSIPPKMHIT